MVTKISRQAQTQHTDYRCTRFNHEAAPTQNSGLIGVKVRLADYARDANRSLCRCSKIMQPAKQTRITTGIAALAQTRSSADRTDRVPGVDYARDAITGKPRRLAKTCSPPSPRLVYQPVRWWVTQSQL
jgi:hypothetical protein